MPPRTRRDGPRPRRDRPTAPSNLRPSSSRVRTPSRLRFSLVRSLSGEVRFHTLGYRTGRRRYVVVLYLVQVLYRYDVTGATPNAARVKDSRRASSRAAAMATRDGGGERAGETTDATTPTAPPVPPSWSERGRDARVLLVPVDGSASAETTMVLRWVAENVHRPGDRVHVLHVVPPSSWRRQDTAAEVRRRGVGAPRGSWNVPPERHHDDTPATTSSKRRLPRHSFASNLCSSEKNAASASPVWFLSAFARSPPHSDSSPPTF